jgi:hypothetical protein
MILTTRKALDVTLARYRMALADEMAEAVEALMPEPCKHRNGGELAGCPRCAGRRTVLAAAAVVRTAGGVQQREESSDG